MEPDVCMFSDFLICGRRDRDIPNHVPKVTCLRFIDTL